MIIVVEYNRLFFSYISVPFVFVQRILVIFCVLVAGGMQAFAGQHADLGDLSLEELMSINVSVGTLFDENELDISNTVELVTREQWQARGAKNYNDAIGFLPSIHPLQNVWGSAIAIRGFATNLSVRGIANLVDGVAVNDLALMTSGYYETMQMLGLLNRIEVLRGPGSSLYGTDAFHGVFSLQTFRSDKDVVINRAELGELGVHDVSLQISQALNQNWRINTALAVQGQGDQALEYEYTVPFTTTKLTAERENSLQQYGAVVSLEGEINSSVNSIFSYYVTDREVKEAIGGARGALGQGFSFAQDRDHSSIDSAFHMLKGEVTYQIGANNTLTMTGYHWTQEADRWWDLHHVPVLGYKNTLEKFSKLETAQGADITYKYQAVEGGVKALVQVQHKVGIVDDYKNFKINQLSGIEVLDYVVSSEGYRRQINSVVAQGKFPIWDDVVHLVLGGRLDYYSDLGEQSTPKAGVIYRPNPNQSFRINYGQAFRAPSPDELGNLLIGSADDDLDPEIIDTYEISYIQIAKKQRYFLALFSSQWKNSIEVDNNVYLNHRRESAGAEFSVKGVSNSLNYEFNGAYVYSRNLDIRKGAGAFPGVALNAIGSYYWHQHNIEFTLANRLKMQMKEGPASSSEANPKSLPTYFRMDLNIKHHLSDDASVWLTMRNLANRKNSLPSLWNVEGGYLDEAFSAAVGGQIRF